VFEMCRSAVMTGSIHCLTGGVPVGSLGLFMRVTAAIKGLTGMISSFGALDHVRR
jgi:hypothetical protein